MDEPEDLASEERQTDSPEPEEPVVGDGREIRSLYRHPLAAVGGALILVGVMTFAVLTVVDIAAANENPYRSLVTWLIVPAIVTLGVIIFLIAIRVQVLAARRRGEKVRYMLRIEPSDPRYMRSLGLFLGLSALLLVIVGYGGFKAYETTDSVSFCGETCHQVMGPQNVTYQNGPHARVPCVDCHIGPGGSFWVKSKIDGIRQVLAVMTNSYDRPIHTPVASLRPAQQTCEGCHWPLQFHGRKLVTNHYYRTDEPNSPWTISMLVNIGGGNPRTGQLEGIHWHMLSQQRVEYIATDEKRSEIPWVRVTNEFGIASVYTVPGDQTPSPDDPDVEVRVFDCMDCHNRPSHSFEPPATAMNLELAKGAISADLPFIRKVGLDLLNADYDTREQANDAIITGLAEFYAAEYPEDAQQLRGEVEAAGKRLLDIYNDNFFPEMRTDYRARENHLSHFVNDGCFRCHFTELENEFGQRISSSCDSCHTIVAQGPSDDVDELENDINGLPFQHPVNIGEVWATVKCTQCHTPASGY